jgi:hypothetical protein
VPPSPDSEPALEPPGSAVTTATSILERPAAHDPWAPAPPDRLSAYIRWIPLGIAAAFVHLLSAWALIALAVACAVFLFVRVVHSRRTSSTPVDWAACLAAADVLIATALLGRAVAPFAAVWLVVQTLPLPARVKLDRAQRLLEHRLAAVVVGAAVTVLLFAFPAIPGRVLLGPRYTDAGWLLLVYAAATVLRRVVAAAAEELSPAKGVRPRTVVIGMLLAHVGCVLGFGPSPVSIVVAGFLVTFATVAVLSLRLLTPGPVTQQLKPPQNLWGLPPVNVVAGLTVIALAVRLLVDRGLWVDEAISIAQVKLPFAQMIDQLRNEDIHPPLYLSMLWGMVRAFGTSPIAVRLPSIVAGTLLIPLLYVTGRDIYDRRAGVMAAALGTFAPLLVWYSQEARMYALLLLFAVAALWFQVRAVRNGRRLDWIAFGVCSAAMLWTHYFAVLQLVAQVGALAVLAVRRRREGESLRPLLDGWALSMAVLLVLLAPLAPFFRHQLAFSDQLSGLDVPARNPELQGLSIYAILANLVWALWGYHSEGLMRQIVALWPLCMLFVLFLLGRGRARVTWLLAGAMFVPLIVLFVASLRLRDLFEVRYFITAVPAALLLIAHFVTRPGSRRFATGAAATVLLLSFGVGLVDQQVSPSNPRRYDFEGALTYVRDNAKPGDVVLYAPRYLEKVVEYYAPDVKARPLIRGPIHGNRTFVLSSMELTDQVESRSRVQLLINQTASGRHQIAEVRRDRIHVQVFR